MKSIMMWSFLIMALSWQCWAIEINVDTVFTSSTSNANTGARFAIRNPSADTVSIYRIDIHNLSPLATCSALEFVDSADNIFNETTMGTDSAGMVSTAPIIKMSIPPLDSLVLINTIINNCDACVCPPSYGNGCVIKALFLPNEGTTDSVILIGPKPLNVRNFDSYSNLPLLSNQAGAKKLYDLSGRCIDRLSVRRYGVFIATYGKGNLARKTLITN